MNRGAELASGETLLFLHADTRLPHYFSRAIHETLSQPDVSAGAFRLRIDGDKKSYRLIEKLANLRSLKLGLPYGDQALFVRKSLFLEIGGFSDIPILEDLEIVRRLNRRGRVGLTKDYVITSARRWERLGPWKTTLINQLVVIGYLAGVSPLRLASLYYREKIH
jgi:rSAM/selenodomain-associated transferase 2